MTLKLSHIIADIMVNVLTGVSSFGTVAVYMWYNLHSTLFIRVTENIFFIFF